ncbi:hypothetical protein LO763_22575 [Glycomyces sp. A-F 0318]|uniref:hypothetical protein n=1 Tax=Glycomyces amatae TaxID=2881355 RepID=UPI001E41A7B1|nr:hypothetical protein [Glycomyces amatae]MCD0446405.1 hypothetical protein [Glycomyces amatae]
MTRDKTVIHRPRRTSGDWVAHCEECDHRMYGADFAAVGVNVALHRVAAHRPARPLPRRCPGATLWLEMPFAAIGALMEHAPAPLLTGRPRVNLAPAFGHRQQ